MSNWGNPNKVTCTGTLYSAVKKSLFRSKTSITCFEFLTFHQVLVHTPTWPSSCPFKINSQTPNSSGLNWWLLPGVSIFWPLSQEEVGLSWWTKQKYTLDSEYFFSLLELNKGTRPCLTFQLHKLNAFLKVVVSWFCHILKLKTIVYANDPLCW